jgi:hypothetical protein
MSDERPPYWFHAKESGWGWGLPARQEGWIVMIAWIAVIIVGSPFVVLHGMWLFCAFMLVMVAILIGICYAKGEPPRWR